MEISAYDKRTSDKTEALLGCCVCKGGGLCSWCHGQILKTKICLTCQWNRKTGEYWYCYKMPQPLHTEDTMASRTYPIWCPLYSNVAGADHKKMLAGAVQTVRKVVKRSNNKKG